MTTVVTSWGPAGWRQYGERFATTWRSHWPKRVKLVVYLESPQALRAETRDLNTAPGFAEFMAEHRDNPEHCGRVRTSAWKAREVEKGYSFRTDAVKFCRKVFALADAAERASAEGETVLAWLDADVVTLQDIPDHFIEGILGDADVAYLGRSPAHSECGFVAYRLPECLPLILGMRALYASGDVFKLPQTHDSYVFDFVREKLPEIKGLDLTPGGERHVWCDSPLAPFLDHCKGERKAMGYSPERLSRKRVSA